jgi:hypothetical protein
MGKAGQNVHWREIGDFGYIDLASLREADLVVVVAL